VHDYSLDSAQLQDTRRRRPGQPGSPRLRRKDVAGSARYAAVESPPARTVLPLVVYGVYPRAAWSWNVLDQETFKILCTPRSADREPRT